jgi:hypothetical protein
MRCCFAFALLFALVQSDVRAQSDPFAGLHFLLGEWRAVDTPPGEAGAFTFKLEVQNHVIVRSNEATYAATAHRPASRHDDLLIVYSESGSLKADYFDSEGHVIRYAVTAPEDHVVVFVSNPIPHEPRYRLTYRAGANGALLGSFEIAPPDSPGTFKPYLSWKATKR